MGPLLGRLATRFQDSKLSGFALMELAPIILVTFVFISHGLMYVHHGAITTSEAGFPYAALQALKGRIPYRDFPFTEMPFSLYLTGVIGKMAGTTLVAIRYVNLGVAFCALLGLALVFRLRWSRWEPGLVVAFAVVCSPHWVSAIVQGTGDAWAMLFLTVAFGTAVLGGRDGLRTIVFALFATAAVMSCSRVFPLAAGLCGVATIALPTGKKRLLFFGAFLVTMGLAAALWFILAGETFVFFNWTYIRASELTRHFVLLLSETWKMSPGAILAAVCGLLASPFLIRKRLWKEQFLALFCFASLVVLLFQNNAYGKDVAPVLPFVAASGIVAVWTTGAAIASPFRYCFWIFPLIGLLYRWPSRVEEQAGLEIEETAHAISKFAPEGPILTPLPVVAVAAQRELYPGSEMGMFSVLSPKYRRLAGELHMTTMEALIGGVHGKKLAAIVRIQGSSKWNFRWGVPDMQPQPRALVRRLHGAIRENFVRVYQSKSLEVLVRK